MDADVPTRATSWFQQALSKLLLFRRGQFRQDLPIRVIGGRTLHGEAEEKVVNEEDGVEEGRSESARDLCRLQGPPPWRDYKTREHEVMATQRFASLNFCRTEEKKTCTRPGTLRVLRMKRRRATSSLKGVSDPESREPASNAE